MIRSDAIGVEFEFTRNYVNHLARVFQQVPVEKYTWYVSCSENFLPFPRGKTEFFMPNGVYSGEKFASILWKEKEYYLHLICLYAVPEGLAFNPYDVQNYADYVKSNAVLSLLCADSIVDFYTKDPSILKAVFDACKQYYSHDYQNEPFRIKTANNDTRTDFFA